MALISRRTVLRSLGGLTLVSSQPIQMLLLDGCAGANDDGAERRGAMQSGRRMDFNSVVLGDHVANDLTPKTPKDFVGIRVAAPTSVRAGVDQFAICGTLRFRAEYLQKFSPIHFAIVLVVVGSRSHQPAAANLRPPGATLDAEVAGPLKDPDWMKDHFIQTYFNVDLLRYVDGFQGTDDDYFIYALIEDHVSNVVRVSYRT
jgi:hypothetical protein